MKTVISILFCMCIATAFAVAGTIIDADPIVTGIFGLVVSSVPVHVNGLAITLSANVTSNELRTMQADIIKTLDPLVTKKASELTEEERNLWLSKTKDLGEIDTELKKCLENEQILRTKANMEGRDLSDQDKKDIERFSFRKLFLSLGEGRALDGVELEMHQEATKEAKESGRVLQGIGVPIRLLNYKPMGRASTGQNIATAADGGYLKQDEPLVFFEALRNALMLPGMGAKFLTNLTGDLPLIQGGQFTAAWFAEDGSDTTQKLTIGRVLLQPKRVQATGAFSRKLLVQSSIDVERMIENDLIASIAQALQVACINGAGTNEPLGILGTSGIGDVAGGENGLAPTWAHIVSLETKVAIANALQNSLSYLTNAKVRGKLKQLEKTSANGQYIWDKNEMNGYPAYVTNAVPSTLTKGNQSLSSAILFGDWSKLYIGQWGGIDVVVDPYSLKKKGEIEVTVLSQYDSAPVWPAAFAAMKDALTA